MPRFAANLNLQFNEVPMLERYARAASAGLAAGAAGAGAAFGASVGLAGAVLPPQAESSITPAPLADTARNLLRLSARQALPNLDSEPLMISRLPHSIVGHQTTARHTDWFGGE